MKFNFFEKRRIEKVSKIVEKMLSQKYSDNDNRTEEKTARNEKKTIIICSSFLSVLLICALIVGIVANHYLNKLNYGDVEGVVSDTLDEEEEIDFDIAGLEEITEAMQEANDNEYKKIEKSPNNVKSSGVISKSDDYSNLSTGKEIQAKANADIKENIENSDGIWYSDSVYNLLIVGYDAGDAEAVMFEGATLPRSDAIILVSINSVKKTVKMVSLSRATYVAIPDHGNKRLNTAHAYGGASTLVETIELNYKIKIDRYVTANFEGFKAIVDVLGGVSVDMSEVEANFAFNGSDKSAGTYLMNGKQALRYVRLRKTDSDRTRTGRQRKVLKAIANQAKNMSLNQELGIMNEVLPYVTTNLTKTEIIGKLNNLQTYLSWTMTQDIIPHTATKLTMKDGKEVLILDWDETTEYIHSILYSGVKINKG